jgi:hypothetical protein
MAEICEVMVVAYFMVLSRQFVETEVPKKPESG